jgi:hypothetical protein
MGSGPNTYIDRYNQQTGQLGTNLGLNPQSSTGPSPNVQSGNALNNDFAVGSRIYNGSSNSPHAGSGGIDLGGYATRDNEANTRRQMLLQMLKPNGVN